MGAVIRDSNEDIYAGIDGSDQQCELAARMKMGGGSDALRSWLGARDPAGSQGRKVLLFLRSECVIYHCLILIMRDTFQVQATVLDGVLSELQPTTKFCSPTYTVPYSVIQYSRRRSMPTLSSVHCICAEVLESAQHGLKVEVKVSMRSKCDPILIILQMHSYLFEPW